MTEELPSSSAPEDFYQLERTPEGKILLALNMHEYQEQIFYSEKRILAAIAGAQSGKTVLGPPWLYNEIQARGPGDYIVGSPTYKLLNRKALPVFKFFFEKMMQLGTYHSQAAEFRFSSYGASHMFGYVPDEPTTVFFGHAADAESLESMTAKAAWLDEAGQKAFKLESWEAVVRRLSIAQGRILLTTTPYNRGWLYSEIYLPWLNGADEDIEVISFPSTANPQFPIAEAERAKRTMPYWKYAMFYLGQFTKPAGLIYDAFDEEEHIVRPFEIPETWTRYVGLDFGGVNTAAVFFASPPNSTRLYLYREYKAGSKTAKEHVAAIRAGEPARLMTSGGAGSEDQWRREFHDGGLTVLGPAVTDVEVGIDRVYAAMKAGEIRVFDTAKRWLEEVRTYSREVNELGDPTEKIEDKETFHMMDATRYIISRIRANSSATPIITPKKSYWRQISSTTEHSGWRL